MGKVHKIAYSVEEYNKAAKRGQDWGIVAGFVKEFINSFDHTKHDPIAVLNGINSVLDDAFADMEATIKSIDKARDDS